MPERVRASFGDESAWQANFYEGHEVHEESKSKFNLV